jgi:glycerophosphoryl diester phosphodiesterase
VKAVEPNLAGAIIFYARLADPVGAARAARADVLNTRADFIDQELCELAHANGLAVQCGVDDPEQARVLAAMGVDLMDADRPEVIRAALEAGR